MLSPPRGRCRCGCRGTLVVRLLCVCLRSPGHARYSFGPGLVPLVAGVVDQNPDHREPTSHQGAHGPEVGQNAGQREWAKSGHAQCLPVALCGLWRVACRPSPRARPATRGAFAGASCAPAHACRLAWCGGTPARLATGTSHRPDGGASCRPRSGRRAGPSSAPRGRRSAAPDHPRPRTPRRGRRPSGLPCSAGARGRSRSRSSDTPVFTRLGLTVSAGTLSPHNPQKPRSPPPLGPPLRAGRLPFLGVRFVRFGPATGARSL